MEYVPQLHVCHHPMSLSSQRYKWIMKRFNSNPVSFRYMKNKIRLVEKWSIKF